MCGTNYPARLIYHLWHVLDGLLRTLILLIILNVIRLFCFYSTRNARIASAVLAIAIPSVCLSVCPSVRLSVTRRYCVKTAARSKVQFAPLDSKICLVL